MEVSALRLLVQVWSDTACRPFCREGEFFWGTEHSCLVQLKPEFQKVVCKCSAHCSHEMLSCDYLRLVT